MKDVLKKYKKKKLISNINIILVSLVLAFGINYIFIDNTEIGNQLKTSILNSNQNSNKLQSDISIEKTNNSIYVNINKKINQVTSLSFSINYNPENLNISGIESDLGNVVNISNTPGVNSLILTFDKPINLAKNDKIVNISLNKKNNTSENINIINANFKDINNNQYSLSTSGITF